ISAPASRAVAGNSTAAAVTAAAHGAAVGSGSPHSRQNAAGVLAANSPGSPRDVPSPSVRDRPGGTGPAGWRRRRPKDFASGRNIGGGTGSRVAAGGRLVEATPSARRYRGEAPSHSRSALARRARRA